MLNLPSYPAFLSRFLNDQKQLGRAVLQTDFVRSWQGKIFIGCLCALVVGLGGYRLFLTMQGGAYNLQRGNYAVAFDHYYPLASRGDRDAQNTIGNLYYLGLGVKQDRYEAARWYLKAALQGDTQSQINLGQQYFNGLGVPRRIDNAVGWFHLAKTGGNKLAEEHLRYIGGTNSIFPLMYERAVLKFENLEKVKKRFSGLSFSEFLLK